MNWRTIESTSRSASNPRPSGAADVERARPGADDAHDLRVRFAADASPRRRPAQALETGQHLCRSTDNPGRLSVRRPSNADVSSRAACTRLFVSTSGEQIHKRVSSGTGQRLSISGKRLADDAADERGHRRVRLPGTDGHGRQPARDAVDESLPRILAHKELGDGFFRSVRRLPARTGAVFGHDAGRRPPNTATVLVKMKRGGVFTRRHASSRLRVPSTLTRMPRSNSASDCPLSTAAR